MKYAISKKFQDTKAGWGGVGKRWLRGGGIGKEGKGKEETIK